MNALVLIVIGIFAVLVWLGRRAKSRRADWRVAAGLVGICSLVGAGVAIFRGEWLLAVVLLLMAGWFGVDVRRRGARRPLPRKPEPEAMSEAKAREILGVGPRASREDIQSAYLKLMRAMHPDAGGTPALAAQINAARDRLLDRRG